MKKLIQTFQNIFKIEELKKRILYTLGLLLIYRFGSFVVIPGINPNALSSLADQVSGTGLLGLLDIFSGGAFANASIFALGVMPYISASIIMQLVGMVIPYFQRMQREGEWTPQNEPVDKVPYHHRAPVARFGYIANLYHKLPSEAFVLGPDNFLFRSAR
ncbi:MAG: preprotein translocase subunit SecY [Alistipes inops]